MVFMAVMVAMAFMVVVAFMVFMAFLAFMAFIAGAMSPQRNCAPLARCRTTNGYNG